MRRLITTIVLFAFIAVVGCNGCGDEKPDAIGVTKGNAHYPPLENADVVPQLEPKNPPVTFFVAADIHLGDKRSNEQNPLQVAAMNKLPGVPYPHGIGGAVSMPAGVLIAGDLTDNGRDGQLKDFVRLYGLTGKDGVLRYPVYETVGNHDWDVVGTSRPAADAVRKRHGGLAYAWEWGGVRMICLGIYPNEKTCDWLKKLLAEVGKDKPVILYFHYSILGPYSNSWDDDEKQRFADTIAGYNIVAIFHGHYHGSGRYQWQGVDIYNVGSCKHSPTSFCAVRIADDKLAVASWNWNGNAWNWYHSKPLKR